MTSVLPSLLLIGLFLVSVIAARFVRTRGTSGIATIPADSGPVRRYRRWLRGGIVAGIAVALFGALFITGLGLGLTLAPTVFAVIVLIVSAVAVATVRPQQGARRRAPLATRTILSTTGAVPLAVAIATVVVTAGVLLTGIRTGSPDDLGRSGRAITVSCLEAGGTATSSATPWPGSWYATPMLCILAACTLIGALVLVLATKRPVLPDIDADVAFRRVTGTAVTATLTFTVAVTGAPIALWMFAAYPDCAGKPAFLWFIGLSGVLLMGAAVHALTHIVALVAAPSSKAR
ncbi:hypothetical protein M0E87_11490 [Corynebacterium sp. CCM 9185]|uniref:Uncharacterized protein n=1 Tax=Corynebacterium marambiense TaxID=2765364 RepID=A0ABS0VW98_9CORY|nr:hypothetical protein [Corynebacterium marambiense]MBI9001029.1 hypothetical protein [Corynebacterium marambiense]MCK7664272.1 hypothetical protein [Corynebacterium marambiense]